jgi:serine/threonine-protein kinase
MRFTILACGGALIAGCVSSTPNAGGSAGDGTTEGSGDSGTTTGTGDGSSTGMGSDGSSLTATTGPYFTTPMFFNTDVSTVAKATNSDRIIAALAAAGGWGNSNTMQVDFDIDVLTATSSTPDQAFTPTGDWYDPDCDAGPMPVPVGGNVEGETGYACTNDGDCHLLVNDPTSHKLYEMWRANITDQFYGGCLATWTTNATYTRPLRGLQCTSADAAGLPISPLLFTADEVKAGAINHAIRFILPNNRIKQGFVAPATHSTGTTGTGDLPSYRVHLRLRADYPIASLPTAGARVVARAMQKYGMYHADGGNIALTAQSDRHTTAKWAGLLNPRDLSALKVTDFEVVDHGAPTALTYDCARQ